MQSPHPKRPGFESRRGHFLFRKSKKQRSSPSWSHAFLAHRCEVKKEKAPAGLAPREARAGGEVFGAPPRRARRRRLRRRKPRQAGFLRGKTSTTAKATTAPARPGCENGRASRKQSERARRSKQQRGSRKTLSSDEEGHKAANKPLWKQFLARAEERFRSQHKPLNKATGRPSEAASSPATGRPSTKQQAGPLPFLSQKRKRTTQQDGRSPPNRRGGRRRRSGTGARSGEESTAPTGWGRTLKNLLLRKTSSFPLWQNSNSRW